MIRKSNLWCHRLIISIFLTMFVLNFWSYHQPFLLNHGPKCSQILSRVASLLVSFKIFFPMLHIFDEFETMKHPLWWPYWTPCVKHILKNIRIASENKIDAPPSSLCDPKRVQRVGFAKMVRNLVSLPASSTKRGRGVVLEAPGLD